MSEKQETIFSRLVHSKLNKRVYVEKTHNIYRAAMPDFYYEGDNESLWCEHKWVSKPWTEDKEPEKLCTSRQWPRQLAWLRRAALNNRQVAVIIGVGQRNLTKAYYIQYPFRFLVDKYELLSLEKLRTIIEKIVLK